MIMSRVIDYPDPCCAGAFHLRECVPIFPSEQISNAVRQLGVKPKVFKSCWHMDTKNLTMHIDFQSFVSCRLHKMLDSDQVGCIFCDYENFES